MRIKLYFFNNKLDRTRSGGKLAVANKRSERFKIRDENES